MEISLRQCTPFDSELLLLWRNLGGVRRYTESRVIISPQEHTSWLQNRLALVPQQPFWIILFKNLEIGYLRFDSSSENLKLAWVSIFISENRQNMGLGQLSIDLGIANLIKLKHYEKIHARVHQDNHASTKLFMRMGFVLTHKEFEFLIFEKLLGTTQSLDHSL